MDRSHDRSIRARRTLHAQRCFISERITRIKITDYAVSSNGLAQKKFSKSYSGSARYPALHSACILSPLAESRYRALSILRLIDSRISITPVEIWRDKKQNKIAALLCIALGYSTELSSKRHHTHSFFTETEKMYVITFTCTCVWEFVKTNSSNAWHQMPFPGKMCTWRQKVPNHILYPLALKGKK